MNWDVMKWLIGIYLGCFLGLLKMAYSDPKFYLDYIDKKFSYVCYTCFIICGALWAGLYLSRGYAIDNIGNDSNLLIVFYVQIMPDDFVMQLHRF